MVRIAEITLDKNGRPAVRITANPVDAHAKYSNIHTHDKNGKPALRVTCEDESIEGGEAITIDAGDIKVEWSDKQGENPEEISLHDAIQLLRNAVENMPDNYINADAATYSPNTVGDLFTRSKAHLVKIYNEDCMPTKGAYTVFSLGWTYSDSNNMPALLAVELATGKLYFFHGNQSQCVPAAWRELGGAASTDGGDGEIGLRGDYCSTYGITAWDYGIITRGSGNKLNIPGGMRMSIPAADGSGDSTELTLSSPQTYTMKGTKTCFLIWQDLDPDEPLQECDQICFRKTKPEESDAICRLWWDGKVWRFRSINYGDVWLQCRAQPLVKCIFNADGQLVRLDFTGWYNAAPKAPVTE